MRHEERSEHHAARTAAAMAMGGGEKLARRRSAGHLNARERVAMLVDDDSWNETGLFGVAADVALQEVTPADGKITGFGQVDGRPVGVVAYDFTVKGSSSSATNNKKMSHVKELGSKLAVPVVVLGESTGVRMPDIMGGRGMGGLQDGTRFLRTRRAPWVSAIFGSAFGSAAWHAVAADFNVMRKGATMAVSSPKLVSLATRSDVDPEELGGWKLHHEVTGFADQVADSDEDAMAAIRRFLGYLPSGNHELPPRMQCDVEPSHGSDLLDLVPESPSRVYDVRPVIDSIVDPGTRFDLKEGFARNLVTALARIDGRSVGIIASNPMSKGGALDAAACVKATSMIVLCDSFNIPIVFLVDQPGFLVGVEAERQGIVGKVINWMNALSLRTVPTFTVLMRKSYGQAYVNMGAGGTSDEVAAWFTAEVSFMHPNSAVEIVHGIRAQDEPLDFERHLDEMERASTAYDVAAVYGVQDVIDPRETRTWLTRKLDLYERVGIGQHLMSSWPTSF